MTIAALEPTFHYPTSRQYPFDDVCEQIVRALSERNWTAPGINVEFNEFGSGEKKYRYVYLIQGDDFKLRLSRGRLFAAEELIIPGRDLRVYQDESMSYMTYVGKDWEQDKDRFMNHFKFNSKLDGEDRWYLRYDTGCDCGYNYGLRHTHVGQRPRLFVANNDLERDYDPEGDEPTQYRTAAVFDEFTVWLEENVLDRILAEPVADEMLDIFHHELTPFPEGLFGPIFTFGENDDAHRVGIGRRDINELKPEQRYGFVGSGYRLSHLGDKNDASISRTAYDGFKWCGFGEVTGATPIDTLDIPDHYRWDDKERYVFRVTPKWADGVYVADHAAYEERRNEIQATFEPDRTRFTDEEVADMRRARARTLVPITDYAGDYQLPVILINRELGLDEVELISGPWPEAQYITVISSRDEEASALLELAVAATEALNESYSSVMRQERDDAVSMLAQHFASDVALTTLSEENAKRHHRRRGVNFDSIVWAATEQRQYGLF